MDKKTEMVDAFGGGRKDSKPPELGVFPLDHGNECKKESKAFLDCLKQNSAEHYMCKSYSKMYLQCRMDNNLMQKSNLDDLGLGENKQGYTRVVGKVDPTHSKESEGFVAGTSVLPGKAAGGFRLRDIFGGSSGDNK